ncbi:MAG TPA: caspase family protein [Pyrinomonadaceae bacterium]
MHILKPAADNINYGSIGVNINGESAAPISEIVTGAGGKLIKINLKLLPDYKFINGRNTVEVWAQNRRGRMYYTSFIIKTANENWNEDFTYEVDQAPAAMKEIPPRLVLLEPEHPVEFPQGASSIPVKISGIATAINSITHVLADGRSIPFKAGTKAQTRQLIRIGNSESSVVFETTRTIGLNTTKIVVEAEDQSGSRVRVTIPVFVRASGAIIPASRQKYALIIGISRYKNNSKGIRNLEYADADAKAIYEFLQKPVAGSFSRDNMLLLANERATLAGIREALTSFTAKAGVNDLLLIFFAGHGAPDRFAPQNLYLIAHDTDADDMPETALSMPKLRRYLDENVKSKRVVLFMDACHSGGLSTEGTRDLGHNLANQYLEKLLYQEEGRAIITSSDVNEPSRESQKWGNGHGVFTYYLLEGLKGSADTNHDSFVSVGELFRYVRQKVRLETEFQQNPRMLIGENENLALAVARPQ